MPACSLPSGLTSKGLPLAIQLAARRGADAQLIQAAGWGESVLGRLPPPHI
jgi:Asp-tRNA(Asn)/Glu-tRNA(Gln) amidotransferase A subunit family amidase